MDDGVSYVMTVYNKAEFLQAALDSVIAEHEETGGEIIIIDDGSTDASPAILAALSNATIITQENAGVAAATNRGIAAARCKYLRLVDGDDRLVPGSTRHLIGVLEQAGCGFVFGQFATGILPEKLPSPKVTVIEDALFLMLVKQPFIPATTLGLTATMQQTLPLPTQLRTAQDFALGLRLAEHTRFAETAATCCIQPADSRGLSRDKARMYCDTVLLARDIGVQQGWGARYRRLALARNAGRARNYMRRHVEGRQGAKMAVSLLAILTRIPLFWPYKRLMTYIANAYSQPHETVS